VLQGEDRVAVAELVGGLVRKPCGGEEQPEALGKGDVPVQAGSVGGSPVLAPGECLGVDQPPTNTSGSGPGYGVSPTLWAAT
jgi:hypothetical protein